MNEHSEELIISPKASSLWKECGAMTEEPLFQPEDFVHFVMGLDRLRGLLWRGDRQVSKTIKDHSRQRRIELKVSFAEGADPTRKASILFSSQKPAEAGEVFKEFCQVEMPIYNPEKSQITHWQRRALKTTEGGKVMEGDIEGLSSPPEELARICRDVWEAHVEELRT